MKKAFLFIAALAMSVVSMAASATYTKVTSDPTDWSGDYILVYEADGAARVFTGVDAASDFVEATISDNTITGEFVTLTLETTDGGYYVKVNGGDNDGKYFSSNTNANDLKFADAGAVMSLSYDADNETTMMVTPAGCVMRYNKSSGQDRFRFYKSTSYTGQQPVQLYKAGGSPVPPKELVSLEIGGTAAKMAYNVGEAFDVAGLIVTGTYDDASTADVTSKVDWTITPETFAEASENASVTVKANIGAIESEPFQVSGIVVTAKPDPVGVTYTKVTADQTDWAGEYVVVYEVEGTARVFTGVDAASNFKEAEIIDNTVTGGFNTIILEATEGGYYVKVKGGDNDGKYISSAGNANELKFGETGATMVLSYDTESASTLITNEGGAALRYNKTSGQDRFRMYKNAGQQPVQLYKAGGSPVPPKELVSLEIGGTAAKMAYNVGEAFEVAGLIVTGTYDDASTADVTSKVNWTITPETFAEASENASVTVKANIGAIESEPFQVSGIVVTAKPDPVGVTYTKVTADQTDWAGEYVVVYEVEGTARVFTGVDAVSNFVEVEIIDNTITGGFNTIILEAAQDGYLVKINGGDNDGKYLTSDKDENGLKFGETGVTMTVSYDAESASTVIANPAGAVLRYNKASNQDRFRFYKSTSYTNQQPIQLYKKSSVGPTGIREAMVNANVRKAMVNGRLIIVKGEKAFDLQGRIVK